MVPKNTKRESRRCECCPRVVKELVKRLLLRCRVIRHGRAHVSVRRRTGSGHVMSVRNLFPVIENLIGRDRTNRGWGSGRDTHRGMPIRRFLLNHKGHKVYVRAFFLSSDTLWVAPDQAGDLILSQVGRPASSRSTMAIGFEKLKKKIHNKIERCTTRSARVIRERSVENIRQSEINSLK